MKHQYILGVSAGFHDAAASLIRSDGQIVFAAHSERYTGIKNDKDICQALLEEFCDYEIDVMAYYERPWLKQLRRARSGEGFDVYNFTLKQVLKNQLGSWLQTSPSQMQSYNHHLSHAAAGFQTSEFDGPSGFKPLLRTRLERNATGPFFAPSARPAPQDHPSFAASRCSVSVLSASACISSVARKSYTARIRALVRNSRCTVSHRGRAGRDSPGSKGSMPGSSAIR